MEQLFLPLGSDQRQFLRHRWILLFRLNTEAGWFLGLRFALRPQIPSRKTSPVGGLYPE